MRKVIKKFSSSGILNDMLNDMDTCIYVSDLQTDEIIFMNDKVKERFNLGEEAGGVCWKVLRKGRRERCGFCPISLLLKDPYTPVTWEEHDKATGRFYKNIDRIIEWSDGRKAHLQHSMDITDIRQAARESRQKRHCPVHENFAEVKASKVACGKDEFLSRMSHEMRTPMNAIIGMTEIAKQSSDPKRIEDCLEKIDSSSKHLLGLIDDVLDISNNNKEHVIPEHDKHKKCKKAHRFEGHTLLIAEDVEINREIISAILEDTKVTMDFAENGAEALSMFEENPDRYDLILMDIHMPEMNGYEAVQEIRSSQNERGSTIPIIALTANVHRVDVDRCIQAGMDEHVGKPVNTEELLSKLDKYLNTQFITMIDTANDA